MNTKAPPSRAKAAKIGGGSVLLLSAALLAFLGKWEGSSDLTLTVYADKLAQGLPTVCSGLTRHVTTTPIIVGDTWSREKCEDEEAQAIEKVQRQLLRCFKVEPPQSVFDSASSHAWNNGAANTCGSQAMSAWNARDWVRGCNRLAHADSGRRVWSSVRTGRKLANGKPEFRFAQGLANRRDDEVRACLGGLR